MKMFTTNRYLIVVLVLVILTSTTRLVSAADKRAMMEFTISRLYNSTLPPDGQQIHLKFEKANRTFQGEQDTKGLMIFVDAPFYDDPKLPKDVKPGTSVDKLWDYEVVEVFFLGQDKTYLEIELGPHGNYLLLSLQGTRNVIKSQLPLENYKTSITIDIHDQKRWKGQAFIPLKYFPQVVEKFNAYAIHKSDPHRVYMALFPTPEGKYDRPDFHRLEYFQDINLHL